MATTLASITISIVGILNRLGKTRNGREKNLCSLTGSPPYSLFSLDGKGEWTMSQPDVICDRIFDNLTNLRDEIGVLRSSTEGDERTIARNRSDLENAEFRLNVAELALLAAQALNKPIASVAGAVANANLIPRLEAQVNRLQNDISRTERNLLNRRRRLENLLSPVAQQQDQFRRNDCFDHGYGSEVLNRF